MEKKYFYNGIASKIALSPCFTLSFWRKLGTFAGPGYLVAVGYMDPGNWATNLAGGSHFGYALLSVILLSNLMAMVLQYLAIKLGIVTGKDLAQACRDYYPKNVAFILWILAEIAIIACDLAEVIGSAIGLNLLFGIPLSIGVIATACDVLLLLLLQHKNFRYLEALVVSLITMVIICFGIIIMLVKPNITTVFASLWPQRRILYDPEMLYLSVGILGATVMPHNLYLHSSLVKTRASDNSMQSKSEALFYSSIDCVVALTMAFFVNAAILITSAAVFYTRGMHQVVEIQDAYQLFTPLLGTDIASVAFAIALLIAGQNSTITGTLAGQIIMEGFMSLQIKPWIRRLIGRCIAIVPAVFGVIYFGQHGLGQLLLWSQIVLSFQLPFAVLPLIHFTCSNAKMGFFKNSYPIALITSMVGGIITCLNIWLIYTFLIG